MEYLSLLFVIIGLLFGYLVAYFQYKSKQHLTPEEVNRLEQERERALQQNSRLEERNTHLSSDLSEIKEDLQQEQKRANRAEMDLAELNAEYRNLKDRLEEQKEEVQKMQKMFKDEFENLANKILEEKSKKFSEQNREKLDQLLKPLGEKMDAFKKKVEETYEKEMREQTSLKEQIKHMAELNKKMTDEAKNLTQALKNDTKTQGRWGEVILQRILEKSGLTEGREYDTQVAVKTAEGGQRFLDVVVQLPDDKNIIIDSKVSLKAYDRFIDADDDAEQHKQLKNHVTSMRAHVKNLSSKKYQELYANLSPDFVLMFVPIESAFGLALQHDSDLYYDAFEKNIVIVSPSTLLATLATIDSVWKQEYQSKNAMEIAERGGALLDKFTLFVESMEDIGMRLKQTKDSYDTAMNRLTTGRGNLTSQAHKLKKLGAKASKNFPEHLLTDSSETNSNDNEESEQLSLS